MKKPSAPPRDILIRSSTAFVQFTEMFQKGWGVGSRADSIAAAADMNSIDDDPVSIGLPAVMYDDPYFIRSRILPLKRLDEWTVFRKRFPDRHQEELLRFLTARHWNIGTNYLRRRLPFTLPLSISLSALHPNPHPNPYPNTEKATTFLRAHVAWRASHFPLVPSEFEHELLKGKCFARGFDKGGTYSEKIVH